MNRINPNILLLTLFCFSCSRDQEQQEHKVFRYNEAANITSLDPAFARDQANIWAVNQLFNGLVQLDDHLNVCPCIASSWEIIDGGKTYLFHLRKDVKFHAGSFFPGSRGRQVTASDFVYSFTRIADPNLASPGAWIFNYVENELGRYAFNSPDDSTLIIRLKSPFPPFLGLLCMQYCSVVAPEAVRNFGPGFRNNPVGTGPFIFKYWKEGVKLVLVRNPEYFESENGIRLPYLEAVSISFLADKQSAFLEFIKGNLDLMSGIDPTYKDELLTSSGALQKKYQASIRLISQPFLNTEYFGFMLGNASVGNGENPLLLKQVRQAINYAFDRQKMIRYLRNNIGTPGFQGIIPKGLPGFDPGKVYFYYNPERSLELLQEAGFPGGKGLPPITLSSTPEYLDLCKYIQHQVATVGIRMNIEISPPAAIKEMKAQAKLPFFRASWIADYPDAENYLSLFYSPNFCPRGPNYTRFRSYKFDALYKKAMSTVDDSARIECYRAMEDIIMEETPVVILYYDQVLRFVRSNIEGIGSNPLNLLNLKRVRKLQIIHQKQD